MSEVIYFVANHKIFTALALLLNFIIASPLLHKLTIYTRRHMHEAKQARNRGSPLYKDISNKVKKSIQVYEKKLDKKGYYTKVKDKLKKAGYKHEYSPLIYLLLKYVLPLLLFLSALLLIHDPNTIVPCASMSILVELGVYRRKKALERKFKLNAYKLYMYLHNQVTSGVMIQDAIITMYQIIDDKDLKTILINLAAVYSINKNIEKALQELDGCFDIHEAQTLSMAIKHGIETGDNREILEGQEEIMFDNYFAYIQAQTDGCKYKTTLAAIFFGAIIIIMITIPFFNDVQNIRNVIFIN